MKNTVVNFKHGHCPGHKPSITYVTWTSMKQRCYHQYTEYSFKGIKVCDRWLNKEKGFQNFLQDMGERPSLEYSIDRKDVKGHYTPENCRWATNKEQMRNRTNTKFANFNGKIRPVVEWAELHNIKADTLEHRLKDGWSIEKALTTPVEKFIDWNQEAKVVVDLYQNKGYSTYKIADIYNTSDTNIGRILKKNNVKMRSKKMIAV